MKHLLALFSLVALIAPALAQDGPLPFPVKIGGQAAVVAEGNTTHSNIAKPVAADAPMTVSNVTGQVIVNIFPSNEKGEPKDAGAQPLVLLFDAGSAKKISESMTGEAPKPGWHLANVVAGGKTSRVVFQVK